jgi:hypothetical protein
MRPKCFDRLNDLVRVLRVQADGKCIDAAELLEELTLSFHHRHRGRRADVAESRTAVPSDTTATVFFLIVRLNRFSGSFADRLANSGDTRRVGHREIGTRLQLHL